MEQQQHQPQPIGKALLTKPTNLFLQFESTQAEPPLENIFLGTGGSIAAAAARGTTDFAISGAEFSTPVRLDGAYSTLVSVPVPLGAATPSKTPMTVDVDNRAKLLVSNSRTGAAINGSLVSTVAGQGAVYLANLFRASTGSTQIALTYGAWQAHSAVVAAAGVRLVDDAGRRYSVNFTVDKERDEALAAAEDVVGQWANGAWKMRQESMRYNPSPTLTKSVAHVPCGVNDSGYNLVHNVIEPRVPYSWATINSMLESAVNVDLEFVPEDISNFLADTKMPGKRAARWSRSLAAGLSMVGNFLVSYRADGRTRITPDGSDVMATESWLDQAPRDATEGNDCDGSAIVIKSVAHAACAAPRHVLDEFEYVRAAKNILVPHFTVGVSVLGASSAEASGGADHSPTAAAPVAGHAAAIMVPTLDLLVALEKGSRGTVGGASVLPSDVRDPTAEARFKAVFTDDVVATLPEDEQEPLRTWPVAREAHKKDTGLTFALAMEGTAPASPIIYASGDAGAAAVANAQKDDRAFAKAAPNVGRSIKILHQGDGQHKFYREFVEFNLGASNAWWTDPRCRELGVAFSQLVFGREPSAISGSIGEAGASPRDLVTKTYSAVPLVTANTETAALLDYAGAKARLDVMPPREPVTTLDSFASVQLTRSLDALAALDNDLKNKTDIHGHPVAYMLAFSTMVNNPRGVEHLCSRLRAVSTAGVVDSLDVDGLARDCNGSEAGKFVVINALVPIE